MAARIASLAWRIPMTENMLSNLTVSVNALGKSDLSDRTDTLPISNAVFMTGIFGDIIGTERPVVADFAGNPFTAKNAAWIGKPWLGDKTLLSADHNNYTSFASFKPDDEGKY